MPVDREVIWDLVRDIMRAQRRVTRKAVPAAAKNAELQEAQGELDAAIAAFNAYLLALVTELGDEEPDP